MTRGLRNNNPLNIRHSADRWQGAREEQTDPSFVQFTTLAYGYRAAWKVLETYWAHFRQARRPFTVRSIVERWAPPAENDTDAYVRTILRLTGLGGQENLPRPRRGIHIGKLVHLLAAMTVVECGLPANEVDTDAIIEGYDLAFPGRWRGKKSRRFATTRSPLQPQPFHLAEPYQHLPLHWDEYWDWSPSASDPYS